MFYHQELKIIRLIFQLSTQSLQNNDGNKDNEPQKEAEQGSFFTDSDDALFEKVKKRLFILLSNI